MVLGGLSFVLPFVGLQLKILNIFGGGAPIIGMFLGVLGAVLVAVGYGIDEEWTSAFVMGGVPACFFIGFAVVMSQLKPPDSGTRNAGPADFGNNSGRTISQAPNISSTQFPKSSSSNRTPKTSFPTDAKILPRSNVGRQSAAQFANTNNGGAIVSESLSEPTETGFENRPRHRIGDSSSGLAQSSIPIGSTKRPDFGSERRAFDNFSAIA